MNLIRLFPVILSCLLMSAHFSRADITGLAITWLILPFLLFIKRHWVARVFQMLMITASIIWIETTIRLVHMRQSMNESWTRLAIILGTVAFFSLLSALVFENKQLKDRYKKKDKSDIAIAASFLATIGLLVIVQIKVSMPMLILGRFFPTFGWLQALALAVYAGLITEKMLDPLKSAKWRYRIWFLFSVVFFSQLIVGLLGVDQFLMTGELHLPVPAMILAGPLYRAEGFFMPILFLATVLLAGPAWCSHLCYVGAWDNLAANMKKQPQSLPKWRHPVRVGILVLIIFVSILLRLIGVPTFSATLIGAAFGIIGVGIMIFFSRKKGAMVHCITYCPIGIIANWIGKINPFRIRIDQACTECGACTKVCRYDALNSSDIKKRKPGLTCTLCGDCIKSCHGNWINYRFFRMKPEHARSMFIVLVVSLHAVFLGLARI